MSCRSDELKDACIAKGFTNTLPYIESVRFKIVMARYYAQLADECKQAADRITNPITNNIPDPEWLLNQYRIEAHTLCVAQMIHTTADYMAQVIDRCILDPAGSPIGEKNVSAPKIDQPLSSVSGSSGIRQTFDDLLSCDEYKYVNAFVNTIKHRRLLDINFNVTASVDNGYQDGVQYSAFPYRSDTFDRKHASTIYGNDLNSIVDHICRVVDELIAFLT